MFAITLQLSDLLRDPLRGARSACLSADHAVPAKAGHGVLPSADREIDRIKIFIQTELSHQRKIYTWKDFDEISLLEQILIGIIPILIGMSSMALFTFLLTFLNQYSINRLVNLQKNLQDVTGSLEKNRPNT